MTADWPARLLRASPRLVALLIVVPVLAGLAGTLAPAFHLTGPDGPDLAAFRALAAWPGLPAAAGLSLFTGLATTALSLALAVLITATLSGTRIFALLRRSLAPLLAIPHAAAALGLAFLIAPSGWIARALSPWATGWQTPPDLLILNDPWGISLALGLIAKELPFLMLMLLAALPHSDATRRMQVARSMGYGEVAGFCLAVMPALYPLLRLPVLAVLSYAMTSVDMGLILGPTRPPTLSVQISLWMTDPGLSHMALGSAAAVAQLALTLVALALWWLAERALRATCQTLTWRGYRMAGLDHIRPLIAGAGLLLTLSLLAAISALGLWSVATLWPFPDALPQGVTGMSWSRATPALAATSLTTVLIAGGATALALTLTLCWLQAEYLFALPVANPWLLYLPLIVPQICFVPGLAFLALHLSATGGVISVAAAHLLFVLPYVFLSLAGPFRDWGTTRIATVAATLGASDARIFWRLRLPMLLAPVLSAAAIGFAVSVGQYLPTLLIGGGRVSTLTTEALALASGGNRKLTSAYGLLQTLWPMLGFALALTLPRRLGLAQAGRT